jgi:hypothetical protein
MTRNFYKVMLGQGSQMMLLWVLYMTVFCMRVEGRPYQHHLAA